MSDRISWKDSTVFRHYIGKAKNKVVETKNFCFYVFRDTSSESEDSSDSSSDELIGPTLPPKMVGEPVNLMEEDILGPLPPPLDEEEEEDDDDDEGEDGEEEVSIHWE